MKYYRCKNYELLEKRLKVGDKVKIISAKRVLGNWDMILCLGLLCLKSVGKNLQLEKK